MADVEKHDVEKVGVDAQNAEMAIRAIYKEQLPLEAPKDLVSAVAGRIQLRALLVVVMELAERFTFYGSSLMFQLYMRNMLGFSAEAATAINRGFTFFCYATVVFGAVLADTYLGKYKAILVFSCWYTIGLIIMSGTAFPSSLEKGMGSAGFIIATYAFISFGTGGIKSNVSSFAAEQVTPGYKATKVPGVYIDSKLTVERVFRYFYWSINVGSLVGQAICPQVAKNVNYGVAYLIPACMFVVGIVIYVCGSSIYVKVPPNGSVLLKALNCMRYARSNKQAGQEHWLDGALNHPDGAWSNEFVRGLKKSIRACKVFLFYPFYWALYHNMTDLFINQAMTMESPSWLSVDQLNLINPTVIVICIPLFDFTLFPWIKRRGWRFGPITRMTTGFSIVVTGFIWVTILQKMIYNTGPYYDFTGVGPNGELIDVPKEGAYNNISVWWQIVPYIGIATSEIFSSVTGLEFAFKQAPAELKSVVTAMYLFTNCGGSLIGLILSIWSGDPTVLYVFIAQTAILAVLAFVFYFTFRHYDEDYE